MKLVQFKKNKEDVVEVAYCKYCMNYFVIDDYNEVFYTYEIDPVYQEERIRFDCPVCNRNVDGLREYASESELELI